MLTESDSPAPPEHHQAEGNWQKEAALLVDVRTSICTLWITLMWSMTNAQHHHVQVSPAKEIREAAPIRSLWMDLHKEHL